MAEGGGEEGFGFLTEKIGPLPVWAYALGAVGIYYWYTHYGPGASSSSATGSGTGKTDIQTQVTDNVPVSGGANYKTNEEWMAAALNFLVGESVPPDQASAALWNYLHSKDLNTQEQKDVNLAIEGIGPPPHIPAPATQPIPVDNHHQPPPPKPPHPHPKPRRPGPHRHDPFPRHGRPPIGGGGPPVAGGPPGSNPPPKPRRVTVPPRRRTSL